MKACNILLFFWLSLIASTIAVAKNIQIEDIQALTKVFLEKKMYQQLPKEDHNNVVVTIRQINKHLNLTECDKPLTLTTQGQSLQRNTSVKVSCFGSHPWSIYINSTIAIKKMIFAVKHELSRHHIIEHNDLMKIERDIYTLRGGYSTQANTIVGKQLKRALRSGNIIYNYHLKNPDIIKKGDKITVVIKRGSLSVMNTGIALNDASKGEKLRVKNQRSSRVVHTRVIGPNTVEAL